MVDETPRYTLVVARSGNSFPTAGCRLVSVETGSQYNFEFFLYVITPNGNEFRIEKGLPGWSRDRQTPNWMTMMRDRITDAVMAGELQLDLRQPDPRYELPKEKTSAKK